MTLEVLGQFAGGLILLIAGGELLVRGASRLAELLGLSPLVIGLTVVAFGTSSPELAVSVQSSLAGEADIAVGNVVGSNIFNILFILGLSSAIVPLTVARQVIRSEVPIMIAVSLVFWLIALDGNISRLEAAGLVVGIVSYTAILVRQSRKDTIQARTAHNEKTTAASGSKKKSRRGLLLYGALVFAGLSLLVLGSRWLVDSAVAISRLLGVDELMIGLTVVAAGTSLPEVATSIVAAIKGERDIAVGNVVGSNIFNILCVLGFSGVASAEGINVASAALHFDIPIMVATAVACLPIFFTDNRISRWEGGLFLAYYVAYTAFLVLDAQEHHAIPVFSSVMMWFVIPLTVLTLAIVATRELRKRAKASS